MDKSTILFEDVCAFINDHNITCVEDIYQRETVYDSCVDLVAKLVETLLEE